MIRLPESWSDFEITEEIGKGAYGTVYAVEDVNNGDEFAVKVISIPRDKAEEDYIRKTQGMQAGNYCDGLAEAFYSEIKLMKALEDNNNVVRIFDHVSEQKAGGIGRNIFIRMELLEDIRDLEFDEEKVIRLGMDICSALEECEKQNIIHRDLKDSNVLMDQNGTFKLTDFGVATEADKTNGRSVRGTFSYMAPEVYKAQPYNHQCDIYSLGLILHYLLNNRRMPFVDQEKQIVSHEDKEEAMQRRMAGETLPPPVNASPGMAEIIEKACAFAIDRRYKSASQMKADLWKLKLGTYRARRKKRRKKRALSYDKKTTIRKSAVITVCLIAAAVLTFFGVRQAVNSLNYENVDTVTGSTMNGNGILKTNGTSSIETLLGNRQDLLSKVTEVIFTQEVKELPEKMFAGCTSLKKVELPSGLRAISSGAFSDCSSLESLTIPESVERIGSSAFSNCTSLKEISIPEKVETIGPMAFEGCTSLTRVAGGRGLTSLSNRCFRQCSSLTAVESLGDIRFLTEAAFESCSSLEEITLPENLVQIEKGAFSNCTALKKVTLPEAARYDEDCFENCGNVTIERY